MPSSLCKQAQGTPGGAAAKEVARLSLHRVRDLQMQLSEAKERALAADKSGAQLAGRLAEAEAKLAAAHNETVAKTAQAAELSAALAALEERARAEEQGRQAACTQVTVSAKSWFVRCLPGSRHDFCRLPASTSFFLSCALPGTCIAQLRPCCHLPTHQALQEALAKAHADMAELTVVREAAAADRDAAANLGPLQAGGGLAVAVLLPFVQAAYFMTRFLLWLLNGMERLGFR